MATVINYAADAEVLDIGIPSAIAWSSTENSKTLDGLYTSVLFNSSSGISKYLYLSNFGYDLPEFAVVTSISLTIKRRAVGTVADYYVGLIYPEGEDITITTPGKEFPTLWTNLAVTLSYGGDLWNKTWTNTEINDPSFGFAFAIQGNTSGTNAGFIDYGFLTIVYHQEVTIVGGSGGTTLNGSYATQMTHENVGSGGVACAGHIGLPVTETASGGILGGGVAFVQHAIGVYGGAVANSSADITVSYNTGRRNGGVDGGGIADRYYIRFNTGSGGCTVNGTGISAQYFLPTGGLYWDNMIETDLAVFNVSVTGGIRGAGLALVDPEVMLGGIRDGGTATVFNIANNTITGGVLGAGSAFNNVYISASGGVTLGGSGRDSKEITIPDWSFDLTGDQVVPPVTTSATAHADVWYNPISRQASWQITYSDLVPTDAHLHSGAPEGANGEIDTFISDDLVSNPLTRTIVLTHANVALLRDYLYFDLHTEDHPEGELRGQFRRKGVSLAGEAEVKPFYEIISGGCRISGTAIVHPYAMDGGCEVGGTVAPHMVYSGDLFPDAISFYCSGEKDVPANPTSNLTAIVTMFLDTVTRKLYFMIRHNQTGTTLNVVRLRGPASETENATTQIQIDAFMSTASPIMGATILTTDQVAIYQNGLAYVYLERSITQESARGQINRKALKLSGYGVSDYPEHPISGGVLGGSSCVPTMRSSNIASGGAYLNSTVFTWIEEGVAGGSAGAGSADVVVSYNIDGSAGAYGGGLGSIDVGYSISITSAGVYGSGSLGTGVFSPVSGGVYGAGASVNYKSTFLTGSGGIVGGGVLIYTLVFTDRMRGGIRLGGRIARSFKAHHVTTVQKGLGAAMNSSNILQVVVTKEELIQVTMDQPDVAFTPKQPGWCDFGDSCLWAYLPKIVQDRQGEYLPPKEGDDSTIV